MAQSIKPDYWDQATRSLARRDPVMRRLIQEIPESFPKSRGNPFVTLVRSIVAQQISVKAADSIWKRIKKACSSLTPTRFLSIEKETLMACGLSQRKMEYILDVAFHFKNKKIHPKKWPEMEDEAIIQELIQIRGIGRWTAEMFLIFNLTRPNVLPVDDLGLMNAIRLAYGKEPSKAFIRQLSEKWQPWCTVATWYLWRSLTVTPIEY